MPWGTWMRSRSRGCLQNVTVPPQFHAEPMAVVSGYSEARLRFEGRFGKPVYQRLCWLSRNMGKIISRFSAKRLNDGSGNLAALDPGMLATKEAGYGAAGAPSPGPVFGAKLGRAPVPGGGSGPEDGPGSNSLPETRPVVPPALRSRRDALRPVPPLPQRQRSFLRPCPRLPR